MHRNRPAAVGARLGVALVCVALVACGGARGLPQVRFVNQPPVESVNDRKHVATPPEVNRYLAIRYRLDILVYEPLVRLFSAPDRGRALNVNSLGDVPNSTWFTNRGSLAPELIRRGPSPRPTPPKPWTVVGSKQGGAQLGLRLEDARGETFLLKFDKNGYPEYETAAAIIVQRLMWALGYNVPEDDIALFRPEDLQLGDEAFSDVETDDEQVRSPRRAALRDYLRQVDRRTDGSYRGLVSRFIDGEPLGGIDPVGVREDDPNDVIPHERRRELRGLGLIYGWLQATDHKVDNSLDMYVEDPDIPGRKYVRHYFLDFGNSLGVNGYRKRRAGDGHIHIVDLRWGIANLLSFGIGKRPWDGRLGPDLPGVGNFDVEHYRPDAFRGQLPYASFEFADRFDNFWAARRIVALSRAQLRAAVDAAQLSDERARDYLVETLRGRARKAARHWFATLSPLADFAVKGDALCFSDLWVAHELGGSAARSYELRAFDRAGRATGWTSTAAATASGDVCAGDLAYGRTHDGYTIVSIRAVVDSDALPPVHVHLARGPQGPRVIGAWRE